LKHSGDGRQEIGLAPRQSQQRKRQVIVAQIFPQVVKKGGIEDSICAAQHGASIAEQVEGGSDARSPIFRVRSEELLVSLPGRSGQCSRGQLLRERGTRTKLNQQVFSGADIAGSAVEFVADPVINGEPPV
jgi:hypothetical protein